MSARCPPTTFVLAVKGDCACVSVTEHQQLSDLGSDDALLVTSTAWTKGFERFKTTTVYRFTAQAGNSCVLEQTVTCEAPPLGFGLQGQVEKTMCSIAAESLEQQMRCAVEFVSGFTTSGGAPSSPLPGEPAVKTRTPRLKSVASMTREEASALGASPPASLKRSASLKRGRQEEVSPTQYYDALAAVEPEAAALADAVSPQAAGGLSRRQSLRRRVASPDAQ